jgi:hypothetical protein
MNSEQRLLEHVENWEPPFEVILATTFTFEPEFFVNTGVLTTMAGLGSERPSSSALVRQRLGNPYVGVLQGAASQGAAAGWIDRAIWDSPRLGLLHAKCVVAAGKRIHCLITSANLTETSWRANREIACEFSCSRDGKGSHASEVVTVLTGLRRLAVARGLTPWVEAANLLLKTLPEPLAETDVVWSGRYWPGTVLNRLPRGNRLTATSPFWPSDPAAADRVVTALTALAPKLRLVTRGTANGDLFDAPPAFVAALAAHAPDTEIAVASPTDNSGEVQRRLHAKQLTIETSEIITSYIGSANVTVGGLDLAPGANVELGVLVPVDGLIDHLGFSPFDVAKARDPQDEDDPELDPAEFLSGLAFLYEADRRLEISLDASVVHWTCIEVPVGEIKRSLSGNHTEFILDKKTYDKVVELPELLVRSQNVAARLPVVLDHNAKHDVDVIGRTDLDDFLGGFGGTIGLDESEEEDEAGVPSVEGLPVPPEVLVGKIRAVHRARDVIERLEKHERMLRFRLENGPKQPEAMIELWLRGPGGIVTLARCLRHAALEVGPPAMTPTAAMFALSEIDSVLQRLKTSFPVYTAPVLRAQRIVGEQRSAVSASLEPQILRDIGRLRRLRRQA